MAVQPTIFVSTESFLKAVLNNVSIIFRSFFEIGAGSFLYYADRIYQLPLALIGIAIGIVLLPNISKQIKENKKSNTQKTIEKAIKGAKVGTEIILSSKK